MLEQHYPTLHELMNNHGLSFRAKGLDVPGTKLDNVRMLETPEDARHIHTACLGSDVVLVGTSFVGTVCSVQRRAIKPT